MTRLTPLPSIVRRTFLVAALSLLAAAGAHAQFGYQELHSFENAVVYPSLPVVDGGDGYLYGVSQSYGYHGAGAVYRVAKATGTVTLLHSFNVFGGLGSYPGSGLTDLGNGFLYGTTQSGGTYGYGTIYRLEKSTGALSFVHSFRNNTASGREGYSPQGPLTLGSDGFLYGTTQWGGDANGGTVYRFDPATGSFGVLAAFSTSSGPYYTQDGVVDGNDGFLYGTTYYGGANGAGALFKVDRSTGAVTTLHSFSYVVVGTSNYHPQPNGVVDAGNGYLYGTTFYGGSVYYYGTVFKVSKATGAYSVVHNFDPPTTGYHVQAGLVGAGDGFLYGTTLYGGTGGGGVLFRIAIATDAVSVVHGFHQTGEGYYHASGLTVAGGQLIGAAQYGGPLQRGTVYAVNKTTGATIVHASFGGEPISPQTGVVDGGNGFLYGTAQQGGAGYGVLYKVAKATGARTVLHTFTPTGGASSLGYYPYAGLVKDSGGLLYGLAAYGGLYGYGVLYRIDPATDSLSVLHAFPYAEGYFHDATLTIGSDGLLYGSAQYGGANGYGTVYKVDRSTGATTVLHSFAPVLSGGYTYYPNPGGVIDGGNGFVYGTTQQGGTYNCGTVYKVNSALPASLTVLHSFNCSGGDGRNPLVGLTDGGDGSLYGTTLYGGTYGYGTVFRLDKTAETLSIVHSFNNSNLRQGYYPYSRLLLGRDGHLYGTTLYGGTYGYGTVYVVDRTSGAFGIYHNFNRQAGEGHYPQGDVSQGVPPDTAFYGTTQQGGNRGGGVVYRFDSGVSDQAITVTGAPPANATYLNSFGVAATGGGSGNAVVIQASGACSGSGTGSASISMISGTGTCTVTFNQAGGPNYNPAPTVTRTTTAVKRSAFLIVSGLSHTFDGTPKSPTVSTSPSGLAVTSSYSGSGYGPTSAPPANAGSYSVTVAIDDENFQGSATYTLSIAKAAAAVSLSNLTQVYTGSALTPTATTTPADLAVTWSGAPRTTAGTYAVTATVSDPNYAGSASGTFVIQKATATVSFTTLGKTYTGGALTPDVSTTPSGLSITWTGAPRTAVGSYAVTATVNDVNYQGSASGTFVISKATAAVTLGNLTRTYTGSPLSPTATTTPTGLAIVWTGAPQTDAGEYSVTATVNDPSYEGSATGTFVITKAAATITLTNLTQTYTGAPLAPDATTAPAGLTLIWSGTPQTDAGSYPVSATVDHPNYQGTATGTFVIAKAVAGVTLANLTQTYTGSGLSPTATTSPADLPLVWTGTPQTNAGSYTVTATVNHANYQGTATGTFIIAKAAASVALEDLEQSFTGNPLRPSATTQPAGLALLWTGAPQTAAGNYPVTATVNDPNYEGTASGTFVIAKAAATVTLGNMNRTYTGGALAPTATTEPQGLSLAWTGTPQTAAGSYTVTATVSDPNYEGSATGTFVIAKAAATVTLTNLTQTFTGGPLAPGASTSPAGLTLVWSGTPQTAAGSYTVSATVDNPNYEGTASGTFVIAKAAAAVTLGNLAQTFTGGALTPTATTAPANLPIVWTGAPQTNAGSYTVTATVADANYEGSATGTFVIAKATPTVTWPAPAPIAYGTPLGAGQLNASASVPGTFVYTPAAGTQLAAGNQALSATFTPADALNYNGVTAGVWIAVVHSWSGVLQPVNADGSSIFRLGRTVPVKFRLVEGSAPMTDLPALIFLAKVSNAVTGAEIEAISTSAADTGNTFRYDPVEGQYIFNLSTQSLSQGTWQIRIDLRDGVTRTVLVSLRR